MDVHDEHARPEHEEILRFFRASHRALQEESGVKVRGSECEYQDL